MESYAMKKITTLLLIIGIFLSTPHFTKAQVGLEKLGQSTMNFLKVGVSPRYAAMGNSATAVVNDVRSMFYNPAGLAGIQSGINAFASSTQWIADINYTAAAVGISAGNLGSFGVSVVSVDYGDIQGADLLSQADPTGYRETGNLNVGALAIGVGFARQISSQFAMGGEIQMVQQNLGSSELASGSTDNVVTKPTLNFGVRFFPGYKSFRFAMSIRNFSSAATYEEVSAQLPMIFQVGVGIDLFDVIAPELTSNNS
ncbi:MAG: PorV/PorQ family protein, partial [Candidatus Marinimicrobia bacterium]|nr:PorV/PorQ family protein [Candidatus Neomarinimicrobiota bacterium]